MARFVVSLAPAELQLYVTALDLGMQKGSVLDVDMSARKKCQIAEAKLDEAGIPNAREVSEIGRAHV